VCNNSTKKGVGFPKPPPQQSPHMHGVLSTRNYPPKLNNANGANTKFSKQASDHTTKDYLQVDIALATHGSIRGNLFLKRMWWMQ